MYILIKVAILMRYLGNKYLVGIRFYFFALLGAFLIPAYAAAETPCGYFIARGEDPDGNISEYREPIENCENPFQLKDIPEITNVTFTSQGEVFAQGGVITAKSFPLDLDVAVVYDNQGIAMGSGLAGSGFVFPSALYKHEDDDFVVLGLEDGNYNTVHEPGTYTIVVDIFGPITVSSLLQSIIDLIIPTAYAQSFLQPFEPPGAERVALTFVVETEAEEPTGASSVLFLPGIMGSRLYEQGQQCDGPGEEQERWFSRSRCEQLRLKTRFDGNSLNDIYTKAEDGAVIDRILISPLYESFLQSMNELEEEDVIADFVPFAYDWRLRLDDILKTIKDNETNQVRYLASATLQESHLYQTLKEMSEESHNGKVTIVAHSNGGLLAKTFLSALQATNDPLIELIDTVILVASPQVGTPDAIVGMLHGNEVGGGFVVSQQTARELLNTAPFGHHLLPNKNYFDGSGVSVLTPAISFSSGSSTDEWIHTFGTEITNNDSLHQFLSKDSERAKPVVDNLYQPEVVDTFLLNYANMIATVIENWTPNPGTKVYQIAGTGIETISGITYFTDKECVRGGFLWFECSEYQSKLGYYPNFTFDGDRTVVVPSALAMSEAENVERLWLDLAEIGKVHNNIFETVEVIDFIISRIQGIQSSNSQYLSKNRITPQTDNRLSFFLLSPLDMYLESPAGITGSSTTEIPGTTYQQYGAVQYVSLPADSSDITLHLQGYQAGSFTLLVQERNGEEILSTKDFTAIPTGTSTSIQLPLDGFENITSLKIDFDGDGNLDGVVTAESDSVLPFLTPEQSDEEIDASPEESSTAKSTGTRVRPAANSVAQFGQVAGITTSADQQQYYQELYKILNRIAALLGEIEKQYAI